MTTTDRPRSPEELMARFTECVAARDLDRLLELYEPDAVFVPQPDAVHRGREAIRAALAAMLELAPTLETRIREVHAAGDLALVIADWSLRGRAPDGTPVTQAGRSADVLRRQADGSFRVAIDHP